VQLSQLTSKIRQLTDALKIGSKKEIYSEKDFVQILERERERANRNNHSFSLVVFDLRFFHPFPSATNKLIKKITFRMRRIDEIGWYRQRQIGIILPYTNFQGAGRFVESLNNLIGFTMPIVNCTIFTYPDDKRKKNIEEDLRRTA
jgi:hypothetical protein